MEKPCVQVSRMTQNSPYAESMNVPFLVRYPQHIRPELTTCCCLHQTLCLPCLGLCNLDRIFQQTYRGNVRTHFSLKKFRADRRSSYRCFILQNLDGDKDKDGNVISYFPPFQRYQDAAVHIGIIHRQRKQTDKTLLFDDVSPLINCKIFHRKSIRKL